MENSHQLQVEHVTRGAESSRLQSTEAYERLNTNLQSYGGQIASASLETIERLTSVRQNFNIKNAAAESAGFKKKKSTGRTLQRRTIQLHCTDCNTGSDNYPCREIRGGQFSNITSSVLDYAKVEIPKDSVIYCDIPYEDTNVYNKAEGFDYERFYDWCEHQTQPVFISSYQMPDDRFDCIEEFSHRSTLSATANNLVTERIYVPKHQKERGNRAIQLSLF